MEPSMIARVHITPRVVAQRFDTACERGVQQKLFEQVSRFLNCALLFTAGSYATAVPESILPGVIPRPAIGGVIMALAAALWLVNVYDAVRHLRAFRLPPWLTATVTAIYIVVSFRLVEVVWHFRSHG
jgi:predicted neutral ceramidase superfamily lipid hydrolase